MKNILFDKKEFIKCVKENVKTLYRKTMAEASEQEVFQAVSYAVKDVIIDNWLATQQTFDKEDPKMVYEFINSHGEAYGVVADNNGIYPEKMGPEAMYEFAIAR